MDERQRIYRRLLDQMADILKNIQESHPEKLEGKVPAEIHLQLDAIEEQIETFNELHQQAIKKAQITEREINQLLAGKDPTAANSDRELLAYAQRLDRDASRMRSWIARKKKEAKAGGEISEEKPLTMKKRKKKKKTERRKKFKRLGGDEGWIPL